MNSRLTTFSDTLPFVGSPAYIYEWGDPLSRKRYIKLTNVLKRLYFKAKGLSWEKAMIEWDSDYDYVVETWKERVR